MVGKNYFPNDRVFMLRRRTPKIGARLISENNEYPLKRYISQGSGIGSFLPDWNREIKDGALFRFTFRPDLAPVPINDALDDGIDRVVFQYEDAKGLSHDPCSREVRICQCLFVHP
jgi:hypothetical protein